MIDDVNVRAVSATQATPDRSVWRQTGNFLLLMLVLALTMATLVLSLKGILISPDGEYDFTLALKRIFWTLHSTVWQPLTTDLWLFFGLPALLVLQFILPARKNSAATGKAILHDVGWMLIHGLTVALFVFAFLTAANGLLEPYASPLRLGLFAGLPVWAQIVVGYLLIDLLGWFNHLLRHKFRVLWTFHEVHHSQTAMNPFTLFRVHPVDYLVAEAIMFLPALLFEETLGIVLTYLAISRIHDALSHSNIRTNLGWLRFAFVTPQSHRVHHSLDPVYHDRNFGVTLCIWDRMFGIHSPSDFVYPPTGIPDKDFPLETTRPATRLTHTLLAQLAYPFVKNLRRYGRPN